MASPRHFLRFLTIGLLSVLGVLLIGQHARAQWEQWRGPDRDGTADSGPLLTELPEAGLQPMWINREDLAGGGGWSSPIVADGNLFQYAHDPIKREDVKLPPETYPPLTDEQKEQMSPEEQKEYEQKRAEENQDRHARQFRDVDRVVCLDAKTGKRIWQHERDSNQTSYRQSSTPAASEGRLYYLGGDRHVVCVDTGDGSELWAVPIPLDEEPGKAVREAISSSPVVVDDRVIVQANRLFALDGKNGSVIWTAEAVENGAVYSSPAVWRSKNGVRIVANLGGAGTVCVDAGDGRELWRVESHAGRSSPVVMGDTLVTYGGSRKGGVRRYEMSDEAAELKWTSNRFADEGSSPVVAGGRVFVQGDRNFACLNLDDGEILWQTTLELDQPRYTSPIAAGETVFYTFGGVLCLSAKADEYAPLFDARISQEGLLASEDSFRRKLNLESLSTEEAEKAWNRHITSQGPRQCVSPAFADGRMYLRLNRGLVCYDLRANAGK